MNLLLDENVPAPMTSIVKMLLRRSHDVQHVNDMSGWSGTQDLRLYDKAKDAGFQGSLPDPQATAFLDSRIPIVLPVGPIAPSPP